MCAQRNKIRQSSARANPPSASRRRQPCVHRTASMQFGAGNRRRATSPQHAAEVMAATFIRAAGIEGAVNGGRWAGLGQADDRLLPAFNVPKRGRPLHFSSNTPPLPFLGSDAFFLPRTAPIGSESAPFHVHDQTSTHAVFSAEIVAGRLILIPKRKLYIFVTTLVSLRHVSPSDGTTNMCRCAVARPALQFTSIYWRARSERPAPVLAFSGSSNRN
jgi:hypothetical protein